MRINSKAVWPVMLEAVATPGKVTDGMRQVISACAASYPHPDWTLFENVNFERDVVGLLPWVGRTFLDARCPFEIHGLYFGLCNPVEDDGTTADLKISATGQYNPDSQWSWVLGDLWYAPEDDYAYSRALGEIYELAYRRENGLKNDAEWSLALAYAALLVRSVLSGRTTGLIEGCAERVGVVVGFESGDCLRVGELREDGFYLMVS